MSEPIIALKNISKSFEIAKEENFLALSNISLEIKSGEFFVIVGPSGSGKSTLLRIASRLEKTHSGSVEYHDNLTTLDISFVFQQFALLPWLTIYENVEMGLIGHGIPENKRPDLVYGELKLLRLEKFAQSHPWELSGGMRQRVGIARALVTNPRVIFMDEPFSELDSFTAEELRQELLAIWSKRQPTIIMVSHIIEEAIELADRIAVLTDRPGRIEKIVDNKLPRPRELRSDGFYHLEDELRKLIRPY